MRPWMTVAVAPVVIVTMVGATSTPPADSSTPPEDSSAVLDAGPLGEPTLLEVDGMLNSVSPDGTRVAGLGRDGTPCIWDIESLEATCADEEVPVAVNIRSWMAWSPDSQRVAFTEDAFVQGRDGDVFVMDLGGTLTNLTDDGYEGAMFGSDVPADLAVDTLPTWSPDGTSIAFVRDLTATEVPSIMTIDPDGGDPVQVGVSPVATRWAIWPSLDWADEDSIVFTTNPPDPDGPGHGVWSLDPTTGDVAEIVSDPGTVFDVTSVSPDGSTALVVDNRRLNEGGYSDFAAMASAVGELDLATGEVATRLSLDVATGTFVPFPDESAEGLRSGLALPIGPQAYSPDGSMWVGVYRSPGEGTDYVVVGDTATGEFVGAADLTSRDLAVGASAIQWVDGGVFAMAGGGRAAWVPVDVT